jgi:hypothetical protein
MLPFKSQSAGRLFLDLHDCRSRLHVAHSWQSDAQSCILFRCHGYRPHRNTANMCLDEPNRPCAVDRCHSSMYLLTIGTVPRWQKHAECIDSKRYIVMESGSRVEDGPISASKLVFIHRRLSRPMLLVRTERRNTARISHCGNLLVGLIAMVYARSVKNYVSLGYIGI